jgi:hypothetical protein
MKPPRKNHNYSEEDSEDEEERPRRNYKARMGKVRTEMETNNSDDEEERMLYNVKAYFGKVRIDMETFDDDEDEDCGENAEEPDYSHRWQPNNRWRGYYEEDPALEEEQEYDEESDEAFRDRDHGGSPLCPSLRWGFIYIKMD